MPWWFISFLLSVAVKFGLPWVMKHFPGIPDEVKKIIEELVDDIKDLHEEKQTILAESKARIKATYMGDSSRENA